MMLSGYPFFFSELHCWKKMDRENDPSLTTPLQAGV